MNIILLGMQGSGKGTVVYNLEQHLDFALVSPGQILRQEVLTGSELGKYIHQIQVSGQLVDTDLVIETILSTLKNNEKNIVIFDGFPRNLEQLEKFEKYSKFDLVIHLDLDKETAIKRMANRLVCTSCGHTTSVDKVSTMICKCGGFLNKRADDTEEGIKKRLAIYESETKPLLEIFRKRGIVRDIDANRYPTEIVNDVLKVINECNN